MIRFSTVAANADVLGEDTPLATEPAGAATRTPRAATAARGSVDRPEHRRGRARGDQDAGRPGRDINAAGFVKDEDTTEPS